MTNRVLHEYVYMATGLTWKQAVAAAGGGHVNGWYEEQEQELREHLLLRELPPDEPVLALADCSFGDRDAEWRDGNYAITVRGQFGIWDCATGSCIDWACVRSATSGSCVSIWRERDGSWTAELRVPLQEGEPYRGVYYDTFFAAIERPPHFGDQDEWTVATE